MVFVCASIQHWEEVALSKNFEFWQMRSLWTRNVFLLSSDPTTTFRHSVYDDLNSLSACPTYWHELSLTVGGDSSQPQMNALWPRFPPFWNSYFPTLSGDVPVDHLVVARFRECEVQLVRFQVCCCPTNSPLHIFRSRRYITSVAASCQCPV